jgi:CO/xanthine dehydrogenase Mo-binding subunit
MSEASASALPGHLAATPRLARWLDFREQGVVTARTGKVELGQGILTALAQIVAEELDVSLDRVRLRAAATEESPNEALTTGSMSVQDSGAALRVVAAEARALFLRAAAEALDASIDALRIEDGVIVAPSGARKSYWQLSNRVSLDANATGTTMPKSRSAYRLVGTSAPRVDLADKVFGRARFIHDLEPPGMLHGRVLRPASPEARLTALDETKARALPGVIAVVRDGSFVGVVAEREDIAIKAAERLGVGSSWAERESLPDPARLVEWLTSEPSERQGIAEIRASGGPAPARTLEARYSRPFIAHASIGPSCALARWSGARLEVWTHSQGIFNLRADLALAFGMAPDAIAVRHAEGAGCYGHNGADDVALDAALLARAVPGRPVRVQWSRADELVWSPVGPAMVVDMAADLDPAGEVLAWRHDVRSNGHSSRPGRAATPMLLAGFHLAKPHPRLPAVNVPLAAGGGAERNARPPYDFPGLKIVGHRVVATPIRTSALRTLGAFANVFAIECFVDEIAKAKGEDPLAWRLSHLADPRARAVLEAAARRANWGDAPQAPNVGRGLAYARYKDKGAYCAVVAEVEAGDDIRVRRLVLAVDVGLAINPDGVANQIEGGAVQATSWTLKESVAFDRTRITSASWSEYPILRFPEVPKVEVDILAPAEAPPLGAGEASQGPTAAAIANAVEAALGVRVRDLPITRARIEAAS